MDQIFLTPSFVIYISKYHHHHHHHEGPLNPSTIMYAPIQSYEEGSPLLALFNGGFSWIGTYLRDQIYMSIYIFNVYKYVYKNTCMYLYIHIYIYIYIYI
jgi:hypothetical protein